MPRIRKSAATPPSGEGALPCVPFPGEDPFDVLGVRPGASAAEVKRAYRTLSARYHPDAAANANDRQAERGTAQESAERFLAVQRAYEALTDRHSRAVWESRAAHSNRPADAGLEGSPRPVHLSACRRFLTPAAEDPAIGHPASAVAAFWRERRDGLRKGYWVVSLSLGIVIVSLSLAPLKLSGGRVIDRLWSAHIPSSPDADTQVSPQPNATPPSPVPQPTPEAHLAASSPTSRPKGMPAPTHAASYPAAPAAFLRQPVLPASGPDAPIAAESLTELQSDGHRPAPEGPEPERPAPERPAPERPAPERSAPERSAPERSAPERSARPAAVPTPSAWHHAVPVRKNAATPPPNRRPRWLGSWTAACLLPQPGQFFLGELEIAGEARFRWRQVMTASPRTSSGTPDDGHLLVFQLEPDSSSGSRLALRDGIGQHSRPAAMLELAGGSQAKLSFPNTSTHTAPGCLQWQLYRKPPPAPLEGLWVLTADSSPFSTRIVPAYLQLRIERRGPQLEAVFQGQYTVPVASIAPGVEFRFRLPAGESLESIPWQDGAGSRGAVSLVPVTASRLAVHWVRLTPSQGRPQLSSGVSILRRME